VAVRVHGQDGQAVPDAGARDDRGRARIGDGGTKRGVECRDVMPVDVEGGPAEALPLGGDRLQGGDRRDGPVDLRVVGVEQHGERAEPVVRGEDRRLPDLALLQLAVADQREDAGGRAYLQPVGQREPDGAGQPHAERPAGQVDRRGPLRPDGLERGVVEAIGRQRLLVEQAPLRRRRERGDDVVPGRDDQAVATGIVVPRVQRGEQLGRGKRLAEVPEPVRRDHPHRAQPDHVGVPRRGARVHGTHARSSPPLSWLSQIVAKPE
jgi:hypothetical protein